MEKRKLLIADSSEAFCKTVSELLGIRFEIQTAQTGRDALLLLDSFQPELLILDLMLPGVDGVTLLKTIQDTALCRKTLVLTGFFSDYIQAVISQMNVGFAMIKPCNPRAVAERIRDLAQYKYENEVRQPDPRTAVTNLLLELGVPTKLDGFGYLREGIVLYAAEPGQQITKKLYPEIGRKFASSGDQVERSIRSAIQAAWKRRDESVWCRYFTRTENGKLRRPTNAEFISRLAALEEQNLRAAVS